MKKIVGEFCESKEKPKGAFDRRSFRWKKSGKAWLLVGCPTGSWQPRKKRCAASLQLYSILRPARGRCSTGTRILK